MSGAPGGAGGDLQGAVEVVDDLDGVAAAFAACVQDAYATRPGPRFTLVLSGGPTARQCYERLAAAGGRARAARDARAGRAGRPGARGATDAGGEPIDWALVDVLMGDERCVPADDPDANQRLVREALIDAVGGVGSFRPMSCEAGPEAYEQVVTAAGPPDVVHLGVGPDGHTASLFPNSAALEAPPQRLVVRSADPQERNPHARMTLTLAAIAPARLVVFTVSGESKRAAWAGLVSGQDLPAARVRAGDVRWIVDRAAAGHDPGSPEGGGR